MIRSLALVALVVVLAIPSRSAAQSVEVQVDRQAFAGVPFRLLVGANGFSQAPQPQEFSIPGVKIQLAGPPQVSRSIEIDSSGRRRVSSQYVFSYFLTTERGGTIAIPPIVLTADGKEWRTTATRVSVREVPLTKDFAIELVLPKRPIWEGETFTGHLDIVFAKRIRDAEVHVPLFQLEDKIRIAPASQATREANTFKTASAELTLNAKQSELVRNGRTFVRWRHTFLATPLKAGTLAVDGAQLTAKMRAGYGRNRIGLRVDKYAWYRATDSERKLEVKALPMRGRPSDFSNAVGNAFAVESRLRRSIVKLGEPVELEITVRSQAHLGGFTLPRLIQPALLSPVQFGLVGEPTVKSLSEDGKNKVFVATLQVKSKTARSIPALSFSFFDPSSGTYRKATPADEIAIQVDGAAIIGGQDVVGGDRRRAATDANIRSLHQDRSARELSRADATLSVAMSSADTRIYTILLYGIPLLLLLFRIFQLATGSRRAARADLRACLASLERAVDDAAAGSAQNHVGPLISAIRFVAKSTSPDKDQLDDLLAAIETIGFDPDERDQPFSADLLDRVRRDCHGWVTHTPDAQRATQAVMVLLLAVIPTLPAAAAAAPTPIPQHTKNTLDITKLLTEARTAYRAGLNETDRDRRIAAFANATRGFRAAHELYPRSPELAADWGNAALGAGELGWATLAFRRALYLAPRHHRARQNLRWLREQMPDWVPTAPRDSGTEALFFWHSSLTRAQRNLLGGVAFAAMVLLLIPWGGAGRRRRNLRILASVPGLVWIAMTASLLLEASPANQAVVVNEDVLLRSAPAETAQSVTPQPIPSGTEITIVEQRAGWRQLALADDTRGWVPSRDVARVVTEVME